MTDDRTVAAGESGGHPSTVLGDSAVTDGVYAAVNSMQSTCFHATYHARSTQSRFFQLSQGHHAVLPLADRRDPLVWPGDFVPHTETKSPEALSLPWGYEVPCGDSSWVAPKPNSFVMANLPTQAGPVADKLTIWPMDDGRYGLDATFQGASGYERAERHKAGLEASGVSHSFRQELGGAWTLRFGPLSAAEVSVALMAFVQ
jgi:hypothetical protein